MIPRVIHYCWFGGQPLTAMAVKCINSWKKFCPNYEIKEWNEKNFDLNENLYIQEAYKVKKWAFVTDYVRLKILYLYGGIYMDTDVEVCRDLTEFLNCKAFSGFENEEMVPTGIMASEAYHPFFEELLLYYKDRHFILPDGSYDMTTNVVTITKTARVYGLKLNNQLQTVKEMTFYPNEYFCPKSHATGEIYRTVNTACIHHFDGSWHTERERKMFRHLQWINRNCRFFAPLIGKGYKYIFHPELIIQHFREKKFKHGDMI